MYHVPCRYITMVTGRKHYCHHCHSYTVSKWSSLPKRTCQFFFCCTRSNVPTLDHSSNITDNTFSPPPPPPPTEKCKPLPKPCVHNTVCFSVHLFHFNSFLKTLAVLGGGGTLTHSLAVIDIRNERDFSVVKLFVFGFEGGVDLSRGSVLVSMKAGLPNV